MKNFNVQTRGLFVNTVFSAACSHSQARHIEIFVYEYYFLVDRSGSLPLPNLFKVVAFIKKIKLTKILTELTSLYPSIPEKGISAIISRK